MSANTGPDTTRVTGLFTRDLRPAAAPKGVFILLHGMESHSGWFVEMASRLVRNGWAVIAYDRAGWGKSAGQRGHLASYRDFVEEASLVIDAARERYGAVHLAGMSWGGMAALYLGLRRGWLFDSITLLAPGLAAKRDISFMDKLRVAADFFKNDMTRQVKPLFNPKHFTSVEKWRDFIENDPDRVRKVGTAFCFETLKMRRFIKENAGKRHLPPTLCLLAGNDAIIDNAAAADICRRAGAQVETIPDSAHTLIFDKPDETAAYICGHADNASASSRCRGNTWIMGAGAVGGAVGSLLTFGGRRTSVIVKPAYLDGLRASGFTLRTGNAIRNTMKAMSFAAAPAELPPDPDLVVLAVKSFDTEKALKELSGHLAPRTVIATLQNGLGNEDKIAAAFPDNTIVAASICASLELALPGKVIWADDRGGIGAAVHKGDPEHARATWMDAMCATGMECMWASGINASQRLKWSKLMLNIGFNALNSVTGLSSAELLRESAYGDLAVQALREGFRVMRTLSLEPIDLPGFPVSKLALLVKAPISIARTVMAWQAARTTEAAFSMRQDVLKKRQFTEINELNGKIVEIGRRFNQDATANAKLVEMVSKTL